MRTLLVLLLSILGIGVSLAFIKPSIKLADATSGTALITNAAQGASSNTATVQVDTSQGSIKLNNDHPHANITLPAQVKTVQVKFGINAPVPVPNLYCQRGMQERAEFPITLKNGDCMTFFWNAGENNTVQQWHCIIQPCSGH